MSDLQRQVAEQAPSLTLLDRLRAYGKMGDAPTWRSDMEACARLLEAAQAWDAAVKAHDELARAAIRGDPAADYVATGWHGFKDQLGAHHYHATHGLQKVSA